jgi:hypothetical protein
VNACLLQVAQLLAPEREKLLHLPEALHQRVVGQDQAVDAVADAIQRQAFRQHVSASLQTHLPAGVLRHDHVSLQTI